MKLLLVLLTTIALVACGGYGNKSNTPPQPGTMPTIAQLVPNNANAGGPAFNLEVNGTSFKSNAVINFNGAAQNTAFVNATKLTTMIPASAIANSATVPVTVTNPGTPGGPYGGGTNPATSAPMNFTIN